MNECRFPAKTMNSERDDNIQTVVELDEVSSAILSALTAQVAILNGKGEVIAFNDQWKKAGQALENNWSHPYLEESILKSLQTPLTEGNDFALRLLLGIKEVLNNDRVSFDTKIMNHTSKHENWYRVAVKSLGDNQGAVLIYEDISEQVRKTNYLRETREKFEKHFNNTLYGILISDENHVVIDANNVACNIIGLPRNEVIYADIRDFLGSEIELDVSKIQKMINHSGSHVGETKIKTSSQTHLPVELNVSLLRNTGGKHITSWAFKDISAQKEAEKALKFSEQQYKLQFNNTLVGTIIGKPTGEIMAVNPAACNMLGYTQEELIGKHRDIIFDSHAPDNAKALQERRKTGLFSGELKFIHKNGHNIPVELSSVIYDGENGEERTIVSIKDISSRKVIQKQLLQEKDFTELAISSMPTAFFVFSIEGEMIRWNSILEQELGYSADELARTNVMDLVHPEDQHYLRDILEGELKGEKVSIEARCLTKQGKTLHYLIRGTSFQQNGKYYIVGGGLNRNDFKEAEVERRRNSELLNQLFFNSPIGIVLVDAEGNVRNANRSFEHIFGYKNHEITGKSINELIVPDHMGNEGEKFSKKSLTGDTFQTETIRIKKDGSEVPVLVGGVPVQFEGEVIAIYGMYVDISERKKLENRIVELLESEQTARLHLEDMFDEAPSAIALMEGPEHTYTYANETYRELVEKKSLVGKPNNEILPELSDQGFSEILDSCYASGKSYHFNEQKIYFNNSRTGHTVTRYLNFVFKPLHNDQNEIYGVLLEAIDVTEQVQARNTIERSLEEKSILLGEVHHRVKNNLAIISGLLELELLSNTDEEAKKLLGSTQSRITSIAKIHELLYQNESLSHVNFKDYIHKVFDLRSKHSGQIFEGFDLQDVILNVNQAIPAGILINELMSCINDINLNYYDGSSGGLQLFLEENDNIIRIEVLETGKNIFKHYHIDNGSKHALRGELIDVLLRQIHGNMTISEDEGHLIISFTKREVKGPHSALNNS